MCALHISKHEQYRRASEEQMAATALLAQLAKKEYMAGEAGRSNTGLRVVKSDGEHKSVWGLRREAGVKMRDTNVGWGGRFDLASGSVPFTVTLVQTID